MKNRILQISTHSDIGFQIMVAVLHLPWSLTNWRDRPAAYHIYQLVLKQICNRPKEYVSDAFKTYEPFGHD